MKPRQDHYPKSWQSSSRWRLPLVVPLYSVHKRLEGKRPEETRLTPWQGAGAVGSWVSIYLRGPLDFKKISLMLRWNYKISFLSSPINDQCFNADGVLSIGSGTGGFHSTSNCTSSCANSWHSNQLHRLLHVGDANWSYCLYACHIYFCSPLRRIAR